MEDRNSRMIMHHPQHPHYHDGSKDTEGDEYFKVQQRFEKDST